MKLSVAAVCFLLALLPGQSLQNNHHRRQGSTRCQTPKSTSGECVNIRKCPELLGMLKNRGNATVAAYLRASQCGRESNRDPKVCCPLAGQGSGQPSQRGSLPGLDVCGIAGGDYTKVVNGKAAALGSWPWMTALGYRSRNNSLVFLCGGSLISDRYVITAAHCLTKSLYLARLGDLDLDNAVADKATPVDVTIEKAIPHENYGKGIADIALLKLKDRVAFTKLIRPICLPLQDTFPLELSGYKPFIAGWGATSFKGLATTALQEAQLEITDEESCSNAYKNIQGATIDSRVICAGSQLGKDTCQGDSGGPLSLPKQSKSINFFLVGVVSYGYKCAEPGYPGIYTRVSTYSEWVLKNMS